MSDDPPQTPLVDDRPKDRIHNYRCGVCGKRGHNARTCSEKKL